MKAYGEVDIKIHILTLTLIGCEWSASRPGHFTSGERAPGTHWLGCWVDPGAGLDDLEKILDPTRTRSRPVVSRYTDCATSAP
jgi:hypothetical protein